MPLDAGIPTDLPEDLSITEVLSDAQVNAQDDITDEFDNIVRMDYYA